MRDSEGQKAGYSWARASALMMTAIFASRLLGMLRDTVIAFRFGQNELTDAYRAAFQLPDLLFFMVAGGALSSSLMPVFSGYWEQGRKGEAWRVFSIVATVMVGITTALVLLLELMAPIAVALMFPGFDADRLALTTQLTRVVLPAQICFLLGGLMMATLYARKHFLAPALGPNIYNIGIIFGGLVLALWLGVAGLAWGALLGAFIGSVLLPLFVMRRLGSAFRLEFNLKHEGAREVFRLMLPVMFGLSLPGIYMLILRVFASWLPPGAISALDNANRQMQAPLGIVGQGIALAIFPALTSLAARGEWGALRLTLRQGLRLVWFLTAPATVLLMVLAENISRVLLQYGKFTPTDTQLVASALQAFALGLFAWSGQALIARGFFALRDSLTPVLIGSAVTVLFVPLCVLLTRVLGWGHVGLALATSIAATAQMVWMFQILNRRMPPAESAEPAPLMGFLLRSGLATLLMGALAYGLHAALHRLMPDFQVNLRSLLIGAMVATMGMGFYLILCQRLGIREVAYVQRVFRRRG
ncbi:MAG: murein biosynthesis integral membrane protein MurJ [Fimbriimonadales bacterium]|nr:murein biosynthesis integral membrane protein MurJ [Fimbriimonadales bacterium]